jgi:TctA family transporter
MSHSYYHSFGMTENYFVFVEYPLIANAAVILLNFSTIQYLIFATDYNVLPLLLHFILQKLLTMNLRQKAFDSTFDWSPEEQVEKYIY